MLEFFKTLVEASPEYREHIRWLLRNKYVRCMVTIGVLIVALSIVTAASIYIFNNVLVQLMPRQADAATIVAQQDIGINPVDHPRFAPALIIPAPIYERLTQQSVERTYFGYTSYQDALIDIELQLSTRPYDSRLWVKKAVALHMQGGKWFNVKLAVENAARHIYKLTPPERHYAMGLIEACFGNRQVALEHAKQAQRTIPDAFWLVDQLEAEIELEQDSLTQSTN